MPGPIFIVGAMGSGTTLLRLVLDSHENIAIPRETGFMRGYDAIRFTPFKWHGNWTRRLGWKPHELDEVMRELYDRLFMRYAERYGKQRWGEKTPLHTWHVEDMARVFPDAQIIGVIRHPSASAQSNINRFNRMGVGKARRHWTRYTSELVRNAAALGDRMALLRYEDLALNPEPVLRELLDWLGESWSDAVLQHHEVVPTREGKARAVEGFTRTDEPIDPSRVDKWTRTMRDDHKQWLAEHLSRRAEVFGYDMGAGVPAKPFAKAGGQILLGTEIAERIKGYEDLDFHHPRHPPITDRFYDPANVMVLRNEHFKQLIERRGVRGAGMRLVRKLSSQRRSQAIHAVRETRAKLGLRRRPKDIS